MATRKCPACAEEIQEEALVCRFCGTRFGAGSESGGTLPPPPPLDAPIAPPVMPAGEVREGFVPTGLQLVAFTVQGGIIALTLLAVAFGITRGAFAWGESSIASMHPAPLFYIGVIALLLIWSLTVRELIPRGLRGFSAVRQFRATVKARYGTSRILRRSGLIAGVVITAVIWAGLEGSAFYNYRTLVDGDYTVRFGMYVALVLPALGFIDALLVLGPGRKTVRMDSQGYLFD